MSGPVDMVLSRLDNPKPSGRDRWRSACPACGGRNKSALSVGVGNDDAVLLRCWKGCEVEAIAGALGLELADLFPPRQTGHCAPRPRRIGMLSPLQCLDVIEFECSLVWTAAHNLANGHGLTPDDLTRLSIAADRITGLVREVRA
jgi:hypothetical protein